VDLKSIGRENTIVSHFAVGQSRKYAYANGTLLPLKEWIETREDTIYGRLINGLYLLVASLTKLFTSVAAMQQLDTGKIALNTTVATYLPDFA
ncbi:hypothetical protein H0H92_001033, partial [Tricholoma furcatifolium]